ncbi:alkylated DNA repair protein alkB homolog 8 isoform X2 [Episyrphus balteatus]|uniref:alkylated DNA repair protein alkB homolog 8 isoform X2 n=1 Tax=Episyrphus balteatus TaxID=286459 RepID=UPI002485A841|nr:alkylated DNA repair protein alkB homolog 8 isoform X2 [Episyrphus balteatus]
MIQLFSLAFVMLDLALASPKTLLFNKHKNMFNEVQEAINVFQSMHGQAELGQNSTVIYMSYFKDIPKAENPLDKELPPGTILIENFVTPDEESVLLASINNDSPIVVVGSLKNRSVKHFGYEFLYGSNLVDPSKPLETKIPKECDILWERLGQKQPSLKSFKPDQLTVNQYMPGHGIPPHVDTHSAFDDPILSLSLESDVVMDFRKNGQRVSVLLPQRSLLIMSGECRYDWTHGITPRIMDVIKTPSNNLTTQLRNKRTSFTFRKIRTTPCNCIYPTLCNSREEKTSFKSKELVENLAKKVEEMNVHSIYEKIANHFSETRHSPWPNVAEFLSSFPIGSVIIDIGCGNGKYLSSNKETLQIGCDRSSGLLNVCSSNKQHVFKCDCLSVPIRSSTADGVISIAVIHHLASEARRLQSINEMARVLRTDGTGLIYVWAKNQKANSKKSSYLRQNKAVNKGKISEAEQRQKTQAESQEINLEIDIQLPVHTNRTEFLEQDVLVPWKLKSQKKQQEENNDKSSSTFLRFYHVFEENELENLCKKVPNIVIERSFYDQGNHCIVFRKLKKKSVDN